MAVLRLAAVATAVAGFALALDNGLGRTPQMGYNSWYDVFMKPSEQHVRDTAQAMISSGLAAAGYKYLNLDDGIVEANRDANGNLVPDTTGFPNGWKTLASDLAGMGLKFGVYTDRGTNTCGGRAGAQGHEAQDAAFYVANGVQYVKEDSCYGSQDHQTAFAQYAAMRDGLNATGTPVFFSLCGWNAWYAPVGHALGNSWRIGPDDTNWGGVLSDLDDIASLWPYAGPGGWNDPCLLLGKDVNGNYAVTDAQGRAQFSMWAIVAAPMLLSQNVRNLSSMQLDTYLNAEVIAVGQDPLGRAGQRLAGNPLSFQHANGRATRDSNVPVTLQTCAASAHTGGAATPQAWVPNTPAAGYYSNPATQMCMNLDNCGSAVIAFTCVTTGGTCCGADCYDNMKWTLGSDGTLRSAEFPAQCATASGIGSSVSLAPCNGGGAQQWTYNAATQTFQGSGGCLTVGGNTTQAAVWGRPLADGAWALAYINAGLTPVDLTCGPACLAATGWDPDQAFTVRDLWARADLPNSTVAAGLNVTGLPADGGIAMYRITPVFGPPPTA